MLGITVNDVVVKDNISIQGAASLKETIALMNRNQKGVAVIVQNGRPQGLLTERDVVRLLYDGADLQGDVSEFARDRFISIQRERTLLYALTLMAENNIRRLIVVDEHNAFLGVVLQNDLVLYLEEDYYRAKVRVQDIHEKVRPLISLPSDASLQNVMEKIVQNNISSLPIVDEGRAVGIITEKDLLRLSHDQVAMDAPVRFSMSHPVITTALDTPLSAIVSLMSAKKIRRVVIADREGLAIGIVTDRDLAGNFEGDYRKYIESKLRQSRDILNLFPEILLEVTDTGSEQLVMWANEKATGRFGMGIVDQPVTGIIPPPEWARMHETLLQAAKLEDVKFRKDDSIFEVSGFYLKTDIQNEQGRIQMILRDISENVKLSTTDALTGLFNRRFLNEFLLKEIARSTRLRKRFVVALVDLDKFKEINDTRNHAAGDMVLKAVAALMEKNLRNADIIARYGGDEFVIVMPETTLDAAVPVLERLWSALSHERIALTNGDSVFITASCGIAAFPEEGDMPADILVAADNRLYKAKRGGRNCIACVD